MERAELLHGIVEADECYVGGNPRKGNKRADGARGRATAWALHPADPLLACGAGHGYAREAGASSGEAVTQECAWTAPFPLSRPRRSRRPLAPGSSVPIPGSAQRPSGAHSRSTITRREG